MSDVNITLLTKMGSHNWKPFKREISIDIKDLWKVVVKGSPWFFILFKEYFESLNTIYPENRPAVSDHYENHYGCVFDLQNAQTGCDYLMDELSFIPENITVCFISESEGCCERKPNYYKVFVNRNNWESQIPKFLKKMLISFCLENVDNFDKALERYLKKYERRNS